MSGVTLTMAPALKPSLPFHRSHSTPDLPSLSSPLSSPSLGSRASPSPKTGSTPQASSRGTHSTQRTTLGCKTLPSLPSLSVSLGESIFLELKSSAVTVSSVPTCSTTIHTHATADKRLPQRISSARPHSWVPSASNTADYGRFPDAATPSSNGFETQEPEIGTCSNSRRRPRSWTESAPAPLAQEPGSPSPQDDAHPIGRSGPAAPLVSVGKSIWKRQSSSEAVGPSRPTDSPSGASRALSRAGGYLTRIKQRPQAVFGRGSLAAPRTPTGSPQPAERSPDPPSAAHLFAQEPGADSRAAGASKRYPDRLSTGDSSTSGSLGTTAPPSAHDPGNTTDTSGTTPCPVVRDPLMAQFADLEAAYYTFTCMPTTAHRMAIVKKALMPFLRQFAREFSNNDMEALWPEDIERRTLILCRWWVALLQILDGNSGRVSWGDSVMAMFPPSRTTQSVAGADRPVLLEAATHIMTRPEWRMSTTYFRPLAERSPAERVRARSDSASARSVGEFGPVFLARSAEHRIRTMFISTLLAHAAVAVDKMSLRHAPASLVSFAGRACAYAFFFVPGVADILVRLWGLERRIDVVTRTVDELGLPRASQGESDDIVALFPPSLGSLGWTSVRAVREKLRRPAKVPLQATQIPWYGPWVSRWRGDDTDLLFVFCKYFYLISEQFVPPGLPLVEKARGPAFVLVHSQLLSILDSTINRRAAFEAIMRPSISDGFNGTDAALTHMGHLPHTNLLRGIDENRLIVLLRDILSSDHDLVGSRDTFAEAFLCLLKAATKNTGRYDHNSQYLLCDFLQEALFAYSGRGYGCVPADAAERPLGTIQEQYLGLVDWPFWLEVCKMMLSNNNTMSEIRVLSFLFSTWDILTEDPSRKLALCMEWLLTEEVFAKFFANWCPMVRAYYMRLLCWRICRDRGSPNEVDVRIFLLASERLRTVWSHYIWLKQKADRACSLPPSVAPSLPQPGKRFMIVRTEVVSPQRGLLASPDSTLGAFSHAKLGVANDDLAAHISSDDAGVGKRSEDTNKPPSASRRWSLLGKVLSLGTAGPAGTITLGTSAPAASGANGRRRSYDDLEQLRKDLASTRSHSTESGVSHSPPPMPPPKEVSFCYPPSDSDSAVSSPGLNSVQFVFRFTLQNIPGPGGALAGIPTLPRDRLLIRPRLPSPAQARVSARLASTGRRSESPPPPAPGLPPPTRLVSGWMQGGLISEARNAQPLNRNNEPQRQTRSPRRNLGDRRPDAATGVKTGFSPIGKLPFESGDSTGSQNEEPSEQKAQTPHADMPVRPMGVFETTTARYAGCALAEWGLVVSECNSFIDRRREEGVLGLGDVEVPMLGVEGLRRLV